MNNKSKTTLSIKKPVLATLADPKYLEYSKQVFAGAYFNGGWKGDFLLLAHNIPEKKLTWFRNKGIYIIKCKPFLNGRKNTEINIIHYGKFYLFNENMKRWSHVIFLDVDTIIRASLDDVLKVNNISAVPNLQIKFGWYFKKNHVLKNYDPKMSTFCSGIMVLNTNIIQSDTFRNITGMVKKFEKYKILSRDEAFFNLYFYNKWQKLPRIYNVCVDKNIDLWHEPNNKLQGIVIHTASQIEPWKKESDFYQEWFVNYKKAEGLNSIQATNVQKWSKFRIITSSLYLNTKYEFHHRTDYLAWRYEENYFKVLNYIKTKYPNFFSLLKSVKAKIKSRL